jgi:hypothetical protein
MDLPIPQTSAHFNSTDSGCRFQPDRRKNFDQLIASLRELDRSLKERAIKVVNVGLSARNWLVGAYLVEFERRGRIVPITKRRLFQKSRESWP